MRYDEVIERLSRAHISGVNDIYAVFTFFFAGLHQSVCGPDHVCSLDVR